MLGFHSIYQTKTLACVVIEMNVNYIGNTKPTTGHDLGPISVTSFQHSPFLKIHFNVSPCLIDL